MRLYSSLLSIAACAAQSGPWPNTVPHYPQYPTRRVTTLTGTWAYGVAPNKTDATAVTYDEISTPQTIAVPMSFDVAPAGIKGLRGTVFYRSTHACTAGTSALARFYAVNFYARLFVDGVEVGNHTAGPYTPFAFVLPACKSGGTRELALVVNNEFNSTLSPTATGGDFYFFSGLIRPVVCTELPNAAYFLDRIEPVTVDVAAGMIDVRVFVSGTAPSTITLALAFNGAPAGQPVAVPVTNGFAFMHNVTVPGGKPWTLGQGNLYTLTVTDQTTNDALTVRSGLRVVGIAPGPPARLTINGEIVKLKGFNRHHSWPDTGAAVTPAQEARDLEVLQGVNANYVRGGHYPQSQSWLDLLDEAGIALWEEALGPGVSTPDIENPYFMANQIKAVTSMVTTSVAHPSVILHGYFNEGPSSDANACVGYKALADTIHSLVGPTQRLVTWASDKTTTDKCLEFADVVSFNNYPGWYGAPGDVSNAATTWGRLSSWAAANFPKKPFTVSETGGGGVFEWKNDTTPNPGAFWSQKYQASLVTADASFLVGNANVSGVALWLLHDFKVDDESCGQCQYIQTPAVIAGNLTVPWDCSYVNVECGGGSSCLSKPCGRPAGLNHKGAVDWWRREKESYPLLAAIYK